MSVHWDNQCIVVKEIVCKVPIETHYRSRQPRLVLRGFAHTVNIENDKAIHNVVCALSGGVDSTVAGISKPRPRRSLALYLCR